MIVNHRYQFIFLRTEKTAGTSLYSALKAMCEPTDLVANRSRPGWAKHSPIQYGALQRTMPRYFGPHVHANARHVKSLVPPDVWSGYLKFAVERNPWDRQVSLYFHREWKKSNQSPAFDTDMRSPWYRNTEYCKLDNWSIYAIGGDIVADRILRFETLEEDIECLVKDLGISNLDLPRKRSEYRSERPHYSTYYSDETRDIIGRWYQREIEALNYEFEDRRSPSTKPGSSGQS